MRRYCLDCSKRTGRLVERVSPRLEKKRAAGHERSLAKRRQATTIARLNASQNDLEYTFDCGVIATLAVNWRLHNTLLEVRRTRMPRAPRREGRIIILYDHSGCDEFDARAITFMGVLLMMSGVDNTTRGKERVRHESERFLRVRPRLDAPIKHAWREIAGLLRAKAAVTKLGDADLLARGTDIHSRLAKSLGVTRDQAKNIGFVAAYGGSGDVMADALLAKHVSRGTP